MVNMLSTRKDRRTKRQREVGTLLCREIAVAGFFGVEASRNAEAEVLAFQHARGEHSTHWEPGCPSCEELRI